MNKAPSTVWVTFIIGLVALAQNLWPEGEYPVMVVVVLVGNFAAGMLNAYWPQIEASFRRKQEGVGFLPPPRVTFKQALHKGLWGN
jgi:hypothetical protein